MARRAEACAWKSSDARSCIPNPHAAWMAATECGLLKAAEISCRLLWPMEHSPEREVPVLGRGAQLDRQRLQAAHDESVQPDGLCRARLELRIALEQKGKRNARLEPCQLGAEAEVDALAEGEMPVRRAGDIEGIRVGELGRVPIGRIDDGKDAIAGLEALAADLVRDANDARHGVGGSVVAQELLDGRPGQLRLPAKALALIGIAHEGQRGRA